MIFVNIILVITTTVVIAELNDKLTQYLRRTK